MEVIPKTLNRFGDREGSFLVESIVALSLVVTGILGIVVLLTRSLGLTANVSQRTVATYLAAEGIEVVKNIIDIGIARAGAWPNSLQEAAEVTYNSVGTPGTQSDLRWRSARPLMFQANGTYSYEPGGVEMPFRRTVLIRSLGGGEEIKVNSVVQWTVRGTEETLNLEDHFFNWRKP